MEIEFRDKLLECKDCGRQFLWEAGEQKYYRNRRLRTPVRCPECREARRLAINPPPGEEIPPRGSPDPVTAETIGGTFSGPWPGGQP